ncbi:uncharacterized protein LOC117647815 [Thrips palmi]|uniref:Uncharacterized protein LOC117647815 n=1 Tax=Thrips palmi TaxID=161013 RepID=A0A6P8YZS0_THRPL|nr:uncharacterized protein LOC117647815 [Thrips palmi]
MRYADADDSDSATPSMDLVKDLVATALVHSPPARFPRPPVLSVKSSTPCLLSPAEFVDPVILEAASCSSTSPRPKFLTQSSTSSGHSNSHSASPRGPAPGSKHRQLSADTGYCEDSGVLSMGNSEPASRTSHDGLSGMSAATDSASGSVSASPRASPRASPSPRTSACFLVGGGTRTRTASAFRSLSEESPCLRPATHASMTASLASSSEHMGLLTPLDMSPVRPTTLVIKKAHRS